MSTSAAPAGSGCCPPTGSISGRCGCRRARTTSLSAATTVGICTSPRSPASTGCGWASPASDPAKENSMSKNLVPGAVLPDFELPDDTGTKRRLSELQGDNPMILMLGRGEHCPRERQHQRLMVEFHGWCAVAFTQLVTILPNDLHDVNKMRIATGAYWPYLADVDLEVQRTLDIREYTDEHHDANVPITLVLAPGLVIDKVYVGYWF